MADQAWATPTPSPWGNPPAGYAPWPAPAPARSGLAIASLVLSILALLAVVGLAMLMFFGGGGIGADGPLTGKVTPDSTGGITGSQLSSAVSDRVTEDGGDVSSMTCPDTGAVEQGAVTVCHATISGDDWAVVVYFEDTTGSFTLDPI